MISALDSAYAPTQSQAQQARAAGVGLWNGYLASKPGVGLLNAWSEVDFGVSAGVFGAAPVGFCSGWDDPGAVRMLGAAWGVRPCLDLESGIRDDGPWVDPWLQASGAGLYGLLAVHYHAAPFRIVAGYPTSGDPVATWPLSKGTPPTEPHGWQWAGTHVEYGVVVDSEWLDDWFAAAPAEDDMKGFIVIGPGGAQFAILPSGYKFGIASQEDLAVLQASGQFVSTNQSVSQGQLDQWPTVGAASQVGFPKSANTTFGF